MALSMAKNMEKALYDMINCLADNYGFDSDAAFEHVRWETNVDHVGGILKMIGAVEEEKAEASAEPKAEVEVDDTAKKIAECKKNISLWEKKLADGKVKDADKQREKIAKEKAKLAKLEPKVEPKAEAEKKVETKVEPKVETKAETKEKRIKRFSPVMASQLKTALGGVGIEMNDKLKKEFQQFIEDLTDDDYRASGLAEHMRAFAKLKAPPKVDPVVAELVAEVDAVMKEPQHSNAAGGGPRVDKVTLKELQKIEVTVNIDNPECLWDADNGRFVEGPDADADEYFVDTKFEGKDYVVGEKTGRVYAALADKDVFAGFVGVGKFKGLKIT